MSACVVTTVMDLDDRRHFPAAWPERDHVLTLNRQQMAPKALLPYTLETRSKTRAIGLVANDRVQLFNPLPANGSSSWASPAADHGLHQTGLNERRGNPPLLGETSLPREAAEHQGMEAEGLLFPGLAAGSLLSHDLPFNLPLAPDDGISGIVSHIAPVLATEAAGTGGLLPPHAYPAPVSTGFQGPMMGPMMVPELPHPVNPDMWLATKGWPGTSAATPAVATAAAPGATAAPMHVAPGGSAPSTPATYMMGAKRHSEEQEAFLQQAAPMKLRSQRSAGRSLPTKRPPQNDDTPEGSEGGGLPAGMTLQGGDLVLPGGMTLDPSAALLPDAALTLQALQALPGADSPALQQQVLQLSQQVTPEQLQQVPPLVAQLVGSALAAGQLAAQQGLEVLVQAQSKAEQLESRVQQLEREKDELKRDNQQLRGSFADAMVAGKQEEEGQQAGGPQQAAATDQQGGSTEVAELWQLVLSQQATILQQQQALAALQALLQQLQALGRQENATIAQQAEALKEFEGLLLRIVEAYQQELARRQQQQ